MSVIARQSTARTVIVGPVLDADGVAVTNAAVGDFKIAKNGGVPAALNGSATLNHRNTGHYSLSLTASDLDTVGQLEVVIDKTTDACPQKVITIVEEAVYDALFAAVATGKLPATLASADVTGIDSFKADVSALSTFDASSEQVIVNQEDVRDALGLPPGESVATAEEVAAKLDGITGPVVNVTVSPLTADAPPDLIGTTIFARLEATSAIRVEKVSGTDGAALDLTGYDSLELIIERHNGADLEAIADAAIERINDGVGFRFSPASGTVASFTNAPTHHRWALRDTSDGNRILSGGPFVVRQFAAKDDG